MVGDRARRGLAGTRFPRLEWHDQMGSTNTELLARAREGEPEGLVVVADHQSAGRGRLGRAWIAPSGSSLLASVLVRPELPHERLQLLTVAMALAAADACQHVASVKADLKWPNDVLVGNRKLAGILAESLVDDGRVSAVVVGIGINVNWPAELPDEIAETATALNLECGHDVDREDLLVDLVLAFERRYPPEEQVLDEFRARCTTIGQRVRLHTASGSVVGEAVAVEHDGRLTVIGRDGIRRVVAAGDVVHLRAV